jgi:hypothetical protein
MSKNIDGALFQELVTLLLRHPLYIGSSENRFTIDNLTVLVDMAAGSVATNKFFTFPKDQNVGLDIENIPFEADTETRKLILSEKSRLLKPIKTALSKFN